LFKYIMDRVRGTGLWIFGQVKALSF
jgi:hypothetical protein